MNKLFMNCVENNIFTEDREANNINPQWLLKLQQMTAYFDKYLGEVISICWDFYRVGNQTNCILDLLGEDGNTFCMTIMIGSNNIWPNIFIQNEFIQDTDIFVADIVDTYSLALYLLQHYRLSQCHFENNRLFFNRCSD